MEGQKDDVGLVSCMAISSLQLRNDVIKRLECISKSEEIMKDVTSTQLYYH